MNASSNRFRLNKTDGKVMGVCAGLADFTGVDATLIRIVTVLLTLLGVGSTILLYLLVGLIAPAVRY
ncbi:PspC domain-containing protein [Sphingomonas montanisoli]|uniref:PspC domain-containing protein n=1 Tax=Sphingomonas montanisoli TaxID=2606412 RepID=A0A5D9CAV0_9SPHN|nr:PspC domain-containing protein [Sphingomonas montanisoli]TZG27175.1 PspC domain-containing protein [Sphingomonas montanisoli]